MDSVLDIGAILVLLVVGLVFFEKYAAQATTAANAGSIAAANRANAWTGLGVDAGESVIGGLNNWLNPGGGDGYGGF